MLATSLAILVINVIYGHLSTKGGKGVQILRMNSSCLKIRKKQKRGEKDGRKEGIKGGRKGEKEEGREGENKTE